MSKAQNVEKAAKANTTAAARKQYGKTDAANAAPKAAPKGRRVPVVAAPPVAVKSKKGGVPDVKPPAPDPHSYGALDTHPPEAMPEVRKVEAQKARGEEPEPEEGAKKGKRKASRKRK